MSLNLSSATHKLIYYGDNFEWNVNVNNRLLTDDSYTIIIKVRKTHLMKPQNNMKLYFYEDKEKNSCWPTYIYFWNHEINVLIICIHRYHNVFAVQCTHFVIQCLLVSTTTFGGNLDDTYVWYAYLIILHTKPVSHYILDNKQT